MSRNKEERLPEVPVQTTESETQTENVGLDLSNNDVEPELPQDNLGASLEVEEKLQDDSTQLDEPVLDEPVLSDENKDSDN